MVILLRLRKVIFRFLTPSIQLSGALDVTSTCCISSALLTSLLLLLCSLLWFASPGLESSSLREDWRLVAGLGSCETGVSLSIFGSSFLSFLAKMPLSTSPIFFFSVGCCGCCFTCGVGVFTSEFDSWILGVVFSTGIGF